MAAAFTISVASSIDLFLMLDCASNDLTVWFISHECSSTGLGVCSKALNPSITFQHVIYMLHGQVFLENVYLRDEK